MNVFFIFISEPRFKFKYYFVLQAISYEAPFYIMGEIGDFDLDMKVVTSRFVSKIEYFFFDYNFTQVISFLKIGPSFVLQM